MRLPPSAKQMATVPTASPQTRMASGAYTPTLAASTAGSAKMPAPIVWLMMLAASAAGPTARTNPASRWLWRKWAPRPPVLLIRSDRRGSFSITGRDGRVALACQALPLRRCRSGAGCCRPRAQRTGAAADAESAAAHHLQELRAKAELGHEAVDFGLARRQLDDEALDGRVEHAAAAAHHLSAHGVGVCGVDAQLQQHEFPLQMLAAGHVQHVHHVHELVQLVGDLLNDEVRALRDQRQARDGGIVGGGNRERFDVVAARGEQTRDAREGARLVLQQNRNDVTHEKPRKMICARRRSRHENKGSEAARLGNPFASFARAPAADELNKARP